MQDWAKFKEMSSSIDETNLVDFIILLKEGLEGDECARGSSPNLHKLRQNISILNQVYMKGLCPLQFHISGVAENSIISFWLQFDPNKEVFDVFRGMNPAPFVTILVPDFSMGEDILRGEGWAIRQTLDLSNPKIVIKLHGEPRFSTKSLCEKILLNFVGVFDETRRYLWSGPRD